MKEVTKEEFKAAFIRFKKGVGKPYEETWNTKLDFPHRNDIRYFMDTTYEKDNAGIIIQSVLKGDNSITMRFTTKKEMDSVTGAIEEAIEEAKVENTSNNTKL